MFTVAVSVGRLIVVAALLLFNGCSQNNRNSDKSFAPPTPVTKRTRISGPIRYVALGDSTGSGVGAREGGYVARLFRRMLVHRPESKLTNYCVSGATTSDVLLDQVDRATRHDANLITLGIGINDIGHGVSLEQFSQSYEKILTALETNDANIIVVNIPDISSAPRIPAAMRVRYQQTIIEFNKKLTEIASKHGVIIFDIFAITHEQLPSHPEYFSDDGFHPSDAGYELWAETMWPTVAEITGIAE